MGCGTSTPDKTKQRKEKLVTSVTLTSLVYGMPDSGQSFFINQMKRNFSQFGSFSQIVYSFIPIGTSRDSRSTWADELGKYENLICAFFFADVSSTGSSLLSIKTYNWLKSQIESKVTLKLVVQIRNPKDLTYFQFFQEEMGPGIEAITYSESQPSDFQKLNDIILATSASYRPQVD